MIRGKGIDPKVSSITNTEMQRLRALPSDLTKCKEKTMELYQSRLRLGMNTRILRGRVPGFIFMLEC